MSTGSVGRAFKLAVRSAPAAPFWAPPSRSVIAAVAGFEPTSLYAYSQRPAAGQQKRWSSHPVAQQASTRKKRTVSDIHSLKRRKIPITVLTAHDYPSARFIESSAASDVPHTKGTPPRGIDICLVGDSLAMVSCGYPSTTSLTLDEMLYHCRSVARGCTTSFLVADMPFGTYTTSLSDAVKNANRIIQEGNMDAVKVEGGQEIVDVVSRLTEVGIPVMGHVGLTPQRQAALSGYRVQGKTIESAMGVYHDALAIQEAGAFSIVLEAVPFRLAEFISQRLDVPTIGIGAGVGCDGQVLVQLDMLGVNSMGKAPRFLKTFGDLDSMATGAITKYSEEVRAKAFPEEQHGYPIDDDAWQGFLEKVREWDAMIESVKDADETQ